QLPRYGGGELEQLASALESMRVQLEGKDYVERYVQTLTHELKGPLAAIRGAAELLHEEIPAQQRDRFIANIDNESRRLQQLIERLLNLAQVEQRQGLDEIAEVSLGPVIDELLQVRGPAIGQARLRIDRQIATGISVRGEEFLLRQALANLLDNALDFTPPGGLIRVVAERQDQQVQISVINEGEPIPDFALPRLTERFYSLPRPTTGRKSTGLGLSFVAEVAQLHGGSLWIGNSDAGVVARLTLPAA
ncbi:MAG: histidine kinase, partial [Gammaproteobacteria bacterium BRH_c0]